MLFRVAFLFESLYIASNRYLQLNFSLGKYTWQKLFYGREKKWSDRFEHVNIKLTQFHRFESVTEINCNKFGIQSFSASTDHFVFFFRQIVNKVEVEVESYN